MPTGTGAPAKEATILGLSQDIRGILYDFQNKLDDRFNRLPMEEGKCEGKPQRPNILDEIIDDLEDDKAHLSRIISFISSDVLPKIN